jgi:hypothetical protein
MTVEGALDGGAGSHVAPVPTPIERRGEMRRRCALADGLGQGNGRCMATTTPTVARAGNR